MKGTSLEVTRAMLLIPPTMTIATAAAMKMPSSHALSLKKLSAAPVTSMRMAAA